MIPSLENNPQQFEIPSKFKKIEFPEMGSDKWYFLNGSNLEYFVKNQNDKLEVSINNSFNDFEFNLIDGKLIGTNYPGDKETIYFQPADTTLNKIEIKRGNVLFVFNFNDQLFFIESIENEIYQKGFIYKLERVGNEFTYNKVLEIHDAPLAFLMHLDTLYIATNSSFISINNLNQTIIFKDTIWDLLYPNSIAYFNEENIILGLRAGIAKLNLKNISIEYFESDDN